MNSLPKPTPAGAAEFIRDGHTAAFGGLSASYLQFDEGVLSRVQPGLS
jgi:hypothetical protein